MNMKNESLWNKYLNNELEENLNLEYDYLIIGGGLAGILTAFYLKDTNKRIGILERNKIGAGVSSKMTAKVTILQDILTKIADNEIDDYLKSQIEGLKLLKNNILEYNLDCDFSKNDSYLFTIKSSNVKKLKNIKEHLDKVKFKTEFSNLELGNLEIKATLKTNESYEINPIKYLNEIVKLLKNTDIHENTNVIQVIKENDIFNVKTNREEFRAKKIIFATNYPYFLKPLLFPVKVRLEKSYIGYGDSKYKFSNRFNAINIDKEVHSVRFYKDKMIYLTGSRMIASKVDDQIGFAKVLNNGFLENCDNLWSNIDIITNDYLPIVGEVLKGMYIITGFNTWGLLSSHIGASIVANLIMKRKKYQKYMELFKPKKKLTLKKFVNSSVNIYESMNGYIKGIIKKNKLIFYSREDAMYIDNAGKCYLVKRKCPHLKCNLLFNSVEKTWDCPCHGSRFDLEGNLISGPSKYDIKTKSVK